MKDIHVETIFRFTASKRGLKELPLSVLWKSYLNELMERRNLTEVGTERAHRAPGPKPAENAPPPSIVVRFLKYSTKEKIIGAAWKKIICVDGKRIFFDHDYAAAVKDKRREYIPVKRILKEKGIRFHTPMTKMRIFLDSAVVITRNKL